MPIVIRHFNPHWMSACALVSVLFLLFFPGGGKSDILARGRAFQNAGKPDEAFKLFSDAAAAGEPMGAYGLGVLYFQGIGVPKDLVKSSRWFHIAAEKGYAPAQFNLGNAYIQGWGLTQDLDSAEEWWRKAARQGYVRAQFNLCSLLYSKGASIEMREEGIAWCRAAAESGFDKAIEMLGEINEPLDFSSAEPEPVREPQRSEARLMVMDRKGFTIQLFSSKKPETAERFITDHQLTGLALRFRFRLDGATWTSVVFGWYANRMEANETIADLKPSLRKAKPWVRPLQEVQDRILQTWRRGSADQGK